MRMLLYPWRHHMLCSVWRHAVDSWWDDWLSVLPHGQCRGVLSTSLCQQTAHNPFYIIYGSGTRPNTWVVIQPSPYFIKRRKKSATRLLLLASLSWVVYECMTPRLGFALMMIGTVLAWLHLTLHQPSRPCLVLHPLYQILQGHRYKSDQRAETVCFLALSVFWQISLFTELTPQLQPLELRANVRRVAGATGEVAPFSRHWEKCNKKPLCNRSLPVMRVG